MPALAEVVAFLDQTLDVANIPDYPGALNGLQLANRSDIRGITTAVDYSSAAIDGTIEAGANLLLVHHGMFWGSAKPISGMRYEQLSKLFEGDVAVYSAHLPLDLHPRLGNNALLAERLGLVPSGGFARYQSIDVGLSGEADLETRVVVERARVLANECGGGIVATPFDEGRRSRRWGICSGAGADSASIAEAARRGLDTLIVGEGPHHTAVEARELGITIIYAGHYATETLGVRALGEEVGRRFGLTATFVHAPTGL
jgi:dinuclear metal center YbgI/SA1388 family protein